MSLEWKSKNKFVKKRRAAHQIMLLSKFANGTFSWISPGLTEAEIGAETQTKVLNIFFCGAKRRTTWIEGWQVEQNGKMFSCLWVCHCLGVGLARDCELFPQEDLLTWGACRLPMWLFNQNRIFQIFIANHVARKKRKKQILMRLLFKC